MGRRLALLIGTSEYSNYAHLDAPVADVRALEKVLRDPTIGGFDNVKPLFNVSTAKIREEIDLFLQEGKKAETLLFLYLSCHGALTTGKELLHFVCKDTDSKQLMPTSISASYLIEQMHEYEPKQLVVILDCCYSGAISRIAKGKEGSETIGKDGSNRIASLFQGRGRVILTSSSATQKAWQNSKGLSVFTAYLIEGLETGQADIDEDGYIDTDEIYTYIHDKIQEERPDQTPGKWIPREQSGRIIIANNPRRTREITHKQPRAISPAWIVTAIRTGRPMWVRLMAVLLVIASLLLTAFSVVPKFLCMNPFPTTDLSSYQLPATQAAPDCEQVGLSVGTRFFDLAANDPYRDQKIQITKDIAQGDFSQAQSSLQTLTTQDSYDAEALIYLEDQIILSQAHPHITVVLGLGFSPNLIGGTRDILQGAYTAQQKWNTAHKQPNQPQVLLVIANTGLDSTGDNAQYVISQIAKLSTSDQNFVGIVGWDDSTSTTNAIHDLSTQAKPITMLSPDSSGENVAGINFFRIVPPDSLQAQLAVHFALKQWRVKNAAIITTSGSSSTGIYPAGLASSFKSELENKNVVVTPYFYTFNQAQTVKDALTQALSAHPKPDLVFFSGYAPDLQTLLEEQAQNSDPTLRNLPIIAGDAVSIMSDYTELPPGFDHTYFTTFASEQADTALPDFFTTFSQTFPKLVLPTHVTDVDEDVILGYDAVQVLLHGYQYQQNSPSPITLTTALERMPPCQAVSGQITFVNGNPDRKMIVLEQVVNNPPKVLDQSGNYQGAGLKPC